MIFENNTNQGNVDKPYKINTAVNLAVLALTNDTVNHLTTAGTTISEMLTINEDGDTLNAVFNFVNDSLGPDNISFSIAGSSLILEEDADISLLDMYQIHLIGNADNGCSIDAAFELVVVDSSTVSTSDLYVKNSFDMLIYPNPAVDQISLDSEKRLDVINFYDSKGKMVGSYENLPRSTALSLGHLEKQVYFVVAVSGKEGWSGKLIISDGL